MFVNVNPNKGTGGLETPPRSTARSSRAKTRSSWEKVGKTLRTKKSKETRTINLGKGTHRVKVMENYGMKGDVSQMKVTLVR